MLRGQGLPFQRVSVKGNLKILLQDLINILLKFISNTCTSSYDEKDKFFDFLFFLLHGDLLNLVINAIHIINIQCYHYHELIIMQ